MITPLTVRTLFQSQCERLNLEWEAGEAGEARVVAPEGPAEHATETDLVGHLNLIHPNRIQVIGHTEAAYLAVLGKNSQEDALAQLFGHAPAAIILADDCRNESGLFAQLRSGAQRDATPLLTTSAAGDTVIRHLNHVLTAQFARCVTLHGVFMEVMGIGVLLTGDRGVGKSELALELISRGHRLIADDAPEFSRIPEDTLTGTCPEPLRDFLEVRGLGVLNVRAMFGDNAVRPSKYLRLIVHLQRMGDEDILKIERLPKRRQTRAVLELEIPQIVLPVAPGRNLAVLVEGAVRNHILLMGGYDAEHDFTTRHRHFMVGDAS